MICVLPILLLASAARADTASDMAALQALVLSQGSTIQTFQASLGAQDNKLHELTALVQSLQATAQQQITTISQHETTINSLQATVNQQKQTISHQSNTISSLQHALQHQQHTTTSPPPRTTPNTQAADIKSLQTSVQHQNGVVSTLERTVSHQASTLSQQDATIHTVQTQLHALQTQLATQGETVGFYATRSGHNAVTLTPGATVRFESTITNVGNGYNSNTGIFTAPYSGLYVFHLHIFGGRTHSEYMNVGIYKGSIVFSIAYFDADGSSANHVGSAVGVISLAKHDQVSVKFMSGNPTLQGTGATAFTGFLIHPM